MGGRINREAFKTLIDGNIAVINQALPHHSLERQHTVLVLNSSIHTHYIIFPAVERILHKLDRGEALSEELLEPLRDWVKAERGVPS